jgi:hypothetical protein
MKILKLTPFVIFFLLLVVLLISVMFSYVIPEGMIGYNKNAGIMSQMAVPPYSSTKQIYRVYDSIYYDPNSGNVVEFFGDSASEKLTNMVVMPRTGSKVTQYDNTATATDFSPNTANASLVNTTLASSNHSWSYPTKNNVTTLPYQYQVLYFPWNTDTVMLIHDIKDPRNMQYVILPATGSLGSTEEGKLLPDSITLPGDYKPDTDANNNKYVSGLNGYSEPNSKIYQVAANVFFDTSNQTLLLKNSSNLYTGTPYHLVGNPSTNSGAISGAPQIVNDAVGNNLVIAMSFSGRTMVCVLSLNGQNPDLLSIRNVVRFDPSKPGGIEGGTIDETSTPPPSCTQTTAPASCNQTTPPSSTLAPGNPMTSQFPMVCPALTCPDVKLSCPGGGGGGGDSSGNNTLANLIAEAYIRNTDWTKLRQKGSGSGTESDGTSLGKTISGDVTKLGLGAELLGGAALAGTGMLASQAISTTGDIIGGTVGSVADVAKTGIGAASGLGQSAIGGATKLGMGAEQLAGTAVTSATGLGQTAMGDVTKLGTAAIGGASGVANNAISTTGNMVGDLSRVGGGGGGGGGGPGQFAQQGTAGNYYGDVRSNTGFAGTGQGTRFKTSGVPGQDQYYGAIPSRPSTDFIPVTSDFSKFGR